MIEAKLYWLEKQLKNSYTVKTRVAELCAQYGSCSRNEYISLHNLLADFYVLDSQISC